MSSADVSSEEIIITVRGIDGVNQKDKRIKEKEIQGNKRFSKLIFVKENEVEFQQNSNHSSSHNENAVKNNEGVELNQSLTQKNNQDDNNHHHTRVFTFYNQDIISETIKSSDTELKKVIANPLIEYNPIAILNQINNELNELSSSIQKIIPSSNINFNHNNTTNLSLSTSIHQYNYNNDLNSTRSIKQKANSSRLYNSTNAYSQTAYCNDYFS